jgi:RecJ-like exonuclease
MNCPACSGTGKVAERRVRVSPHVTVEDRVVTYCPNCGGTGFVERDCPRCGKPIYDPDGLCGCLRRKVTAADVQHINTRAY